jgi:cobyrinic acid a,c-diamide synthase
MIPAVLIAGTHSGVGKTTVTLGLMAALKRRGLKVQPFKVGPDFIDPSHHTAICNRPSRNLDPFMMGLDGVKRSFCSGIVGADVAIVEGVMGLYDGMDASETGSTAQVAKTLGIPVLLVLNVHGMSRSAAAIELGFTAFDPSVHVAGTVLNHVGSERHLSMLRSSLRLPIFGALPRRREIEMKSRHLGLEMSFETKHDLSALASLVEENADLDRILELTCSPCPFSQPESSHERSVRIGVALDEAFCFYYQENLYELRRRGAELVFFSPIHDDLPDIDGLYIGGGYPELHAEKLERGAARMQIKDASEDGMPIYGECGGLIYLSEGIVSGSEKASRRMVGALPATTIMTTKLQALGYVEADVVRANPVVYLGKVIRGHEFHYSRIECEDDAKFTYRLRRGKGIKDGCDGLVEHSTLGGYLHTHFYTYPVDRFIEGCREYKKS